MEGARAAADGGGEPAHPGVRAAAAAAGRGAHGEEAPAGGDHGHHAAEGPPILRAATPYKAIHTYFTRLFGTVRHGRLQYHTASCYTVR